MKIVAAASIVVAIPLVVVLAACTGGSVTIHSPSPTVPSPTPSLPGLNDTYTPLNPDTLFPTTDTATPTPSDTVTSVALQLIARTDGNGFSSITWADRPGGIQQVTDVAGSVWKKTLPDGLYVISVQGNGSGSWVECSKQQIINGKPDGAPFDVIRSTGPYAVVTCP